MQPLGTDRPDGIRTPLSTMLINAVTRELEARGMSLSESPDVVVNFFVNTEQRLDVRQTPSASSYHGYRRGRYRAWSGYDTRVRNYTLGTLSIDLADPSRNILVWEGVAQGYLDRGLVEINQAEVDEVVARLDRSLAALEKDLRL